ncbi:hypothetical protein FQV37_2256 [Psychrobacter nivimaris]|uniref:Bacteriophage lambda Replication protein O N-terminal domain-containing protein n=1 Tax=Psychrobacter nivimaris TaxID=281738 RepID=A0A6N7BXQ9_9GAMM|nr:hypothetical protein [Psychrobacter nivimaris]KAF0567400.1 hypothetical protein FQV37_2256 [Psychrobacter nivimaris]
MNTLKKGVYPMERFTAKPKWWKGLKHKKRLSNSEYMVLDTIYDKTIDWGKLTDRIAISQFVDELGMSNRGVIDSIRGLKKKGLIFVLGQDRKTNTITIKMDKCEVLALSELVRNSHKLKTATCENFSQTCEKNSYQLVRNSHTHDTRDHYPIPFIYIRGYQVLNDYGVCKKTESELAKKQIDESAMLLIEFWNNNHGKSKSADVKPSVWLDKAKARLKNFTVDEIKTAMLSVIQSTWHQQNGQVLIKNAISSDQRCDEAVSRYHQPVKTNYQGNNNAINQSANSQPNHFDQLRAEAAAKYGNPQPSEPRTVN